MVCYESMPTHGLDREHRRGEREQGTSLRKRTWRHFAQLCRILPCFCARERPGKRNILDVFSVFSTKS